MSQDGSQTGSPAPNANAPIPNTDGSAEGITICVKVIEDYRGQRISKWEAVSQIASALQSVTTGTDNKQISTAGNTYLAMLDEHNKLLAHASVQGQRDSGQSNRGNEIDDVVDAEAASKRPCSWSASPGSKH